MPRKKGSGVPEAKAEPDKPIYPEDYLRFDTTILQYGERKHVLAMQKMPALPSGETAPITLAREMLDVQVQYLNMLGSGIGSRRACEALGLSIITPVVWLEESDKDSIYWYCVGLVKKMQADLLEEDVWNEALSNPKATILKMFALKARKDEYKDNATPTFNMETNIFVKIGDKDYDVRANFKNAGGDSEEIEAQNA